MRVIAAALAVLAVGMWLGTRDRDVAVRTRAASESVVAGSSTAVRPLAVAPAARVPLSPASEAPHGGTLTGTLSDSAGVALERGLAPVRLESAHGTTVTGLAKSDGRFAFAGLAFDRWRVACEAPDVRGDPVEVELAPDRPHADVDLVVERGRWIEVQLFASDEGELGAWLTRHGACATLPEAIVLDPWRLFGPHPSAPLAAIAPASQLRAGQLLVPTGREVEIAVIAGSTVLARAPSVAEERVELRIDPHALAAALATLTFSVVDEQGEPRPDATVRAGGDCAIALAADGTGTWRGLAGEARVSVQAPGTEVWNARVRIDAGATLELGRIVLERARSIRGRVLDREGRPCSVPLACELADASGAWTPLWRGQPFRSSVDGRFEIPALGSGRHRVTAVVSGSEPAELMLADGVETVELTLRAGPP